jgi:hypothetical protein
MTHVLGWITMAWGLGTGGYVAKYMWRTATRPWSWQQPVPVPKFADTPLLLGSGSDYVGLI